VAGLRATFDQPLTDRGPSERVDQGREGAEVGDQSFFLLGLVMSDA
jgi:hypothetical protein